MIKEEFHKPIKYNPHGLYEAFSQGKLEIPKKIENFDFKNIRERKYD